MKAYKIEMNTLAIADIDDLTDWLSERLSLRSAERYVDYMISEINSLSMFADLYRPSRYADVRRYHPQARRMVSHNRKWVYIFHIEGDTVVVDRIRPTKMIKE